MMVKLIFTPQLSLGLFLGIVSIALALSFSFFSKQHSSTTGLSKQSPVVALNQPTAFSVWQQFYDLAFTGINFLPQSCSYDQAGRWVVFFDAGAQQLLRFYPQYKRFEQLSLPTERIQAAIAHQGKLYLFAGGLWRYEDTDRKWQLISEPLDFPAANALHAFRQNFYLTGKGVFQRLNFQLTGEYQGAQSWLGDQEANFYPQAVLVSDYVYIQTVNQSIRRFARGQPTNWQLNFPEEILEPVKLFSTGERLLILLPASGRLLIADFSGQVLQEWRDSLFLGANCIYFDEQTQVYTLLNQGKLYQTQLNFAQ